MNPIALIPPKPPRTQPKPRTTVPTCTACDGPLNGTGECRGCT